MSDTELTPEELREKKKAAAIAWLNQNLTLALVMPLSVARDILPSGIGRDELQPVVSEVMPKEIVDEVKLHQNEVYVILKR